MAQFSRLGHARRLLYLADLFEDYRRLYPVLVQIAEEVGIDTEWDDIEARVVFLQERLAALVEDTQLVLLAHADERRRRDVLVEVSAGCLTRISHSAARRNAHVRADRARVLESQDREAPRHGALQAG